MGLQQKQIPFISICFALHFNLSEGRRKGPYSQVFFPSSWAISSSPPSPSSPSVPSPSTSFLSSPPHFSLLPLKVTFRSQISWCVRQQFVCSAEQFKSVLIQDGGTHGSLKIISENLRHGGIKAFTRHCTFTVRLVAILQRLYCDLIFTSSFAAFVISFVRAR